MPAASASPLTWLGTRGLSLRERTVGPGVVELRLESAATRRLGFPVCCYRVDEVLVDAGFGHARPLLLDALAGLPLRGIALTHHHEDHAGAAGSLARRHGCPVWLREPARRHGEGVEDLLPYRRLFWGRPDPCEPAALPARLDCGTRTLESVPTGGHSRTHSAFWEPREGLLFAGDLFVSRGASAVMRHEDPFETVRSLRRAAALEPARLLSGHGLDLERPAAVLLAKAARIEEAAERVLEAHRRGLGTAAIRRTVFPRGAFGDLGGALLTRGEFSRANFVRAVIAREG